MTNWCSRVKFDPFSAPLTETIDQHLSVISAYHTYINYNPIGENPNFCATFTGIFNKRLPKPSYILIWDFELVFNHIKTICQALLSYLKHNLSYKFTVLLAISSGLTVFLYNI